MSTQIMWKLGTHESVKIQSNLYGNIRLQMFDIDKLYLTRLSYRIQKEEKDGKTTQYLTSEFKQEDGSIYHQNELINLYLTLLKRHGKEQQDGSISVDDSITANLGSVDGDTKLITDVLADIESDKPATRNYAYRFGNLTVQALIHQDLLGGKFGIGPFALNNNNQVLTQLYSVGFDRKTALILSDLGIANIYEPKDKDGVLKLSWLSGFINANVDVAKDPYIARLNVNKFTYNLVNLLIRGGMGKRTLYFTTQPVMIEMAKAFNDAEDAFMGEFNQTASQRQRNAVQNVIYKLAERSSFNKRFITTLMDGSMMSELFLSQIAQQLFGTSDAHHGSLESSILYKVLKSKDVRKNVNKPVSLENLDGGTQNIEIEIHNDSIVQQIYDKSDVSASDTVSNIQNSLEEFYGKLGIKISNSGTSTLNISAVDTQILVALVNNQFSKYGNALADLVAACKIDTKKYGKSYVEQQAFLTKYDEVFGNELDYFYDGGLQDLKNKSYVHTKVENATNLYRDIISNISIQAEDTFNLAVNNILMNIGGDQKNTQLVRKINKSIMTMLKQRFFEQYMSKQQRKDLLFGDNTVQDNLIRIVNKLKSSSDTQLSPYVKGSVVINKLLSQLTADHYNADANFDQAKFVILENVMSDESTDINDITRAWNDLFQDETNYITLSDGYTKTFRQFAIDLAVYAFITSGDTNGQTKFFKYVPNTIKQHIGYSEYMRNLGDALNEYNTEDIVDYVIKSNWDDERFVKTVSSVKYVQNKPVSMMKQGITISRPVTKKTVNSNGLVQEIEQSVKIPINFAAVNAENKPTIKMNGGQFPKYVRMKRAASTRFESDYMLLYQFDSVLPNGAPVYKLALPTVSNTRAGSYSYSVYGVEDYNLIYPTYVKEALNNIGFRFTEGKDVQQILMQFVDEMKRLNVTFQTNKQLELQLASEFEEAGYNAEEERWKSYMQQAVNWVQQQLGQSVKPQKPNQQQVMQQVQRDTNSNIYDNVLNNKDSNVQIKPWASLKDVTSPFVEVDGKVSATIATRTKENALQSFGNTYTHNDKLIGNKQYPMQLTKDTKESVEKYINSIINPEQSNWPEHYRWIQRQVKSGNLKNIPILYYKDLGEPSHADALDYLINHYSFDNKSAENNTAIESTDGSAANQKRENWVQGELFDDSEFEEDNMNHCKGMKPKNK